MASALVIGKESPEHFIDALLTAKILDDSGRVPIATFANLLVRSRGKDLESEHERWDLANETLLSFRGCLLAAVAAVIVFDRFDGSRILSLILGVTASVVGTWVYVYDQIVFPKREAVADNILLAEPKREESREWLSGSLLLVDERYGAFPSSPLRFGRDEYVRQAIEQLMQTASSKPPGYVITVSNNVVTIRVVSSSKQEFLREVSEDSPAYGPLRWATAY
jgi:hypothetical protein